MEEGSSKMDEHRCPRRNEGGGAARFPGPDTWRDLDGDLRCSFCGSLHPDRFMERIKAGEKLGPTDKTYKAYLDAPPWAKFYYQHLSEEQRAEFIELVNAKRINIGEPGYLYVTPFFAHLSAPQDRH
jgi:hypothetical protein